MLLLYSSYVAPLEISMEYCFFTVFVVHMLKRAYLVPTFLTSYTLYRKGDPLQIYSVLSVEFLLPSTYLLSRPQR